MAAAPGSAHRIAFLDHLRVFAFVSVLVGHKFVAPFEAAQQSNTPWRWLAQVAWPWVHGGGAGVVVFFLISGYIITHVLQRETAGEFLLKRAWRIYPLYIVAVLGEYALLVQRDTAPGLAVLLPQLLLIGDWTGTPYALASVEWTLRLEMLFYLVMAALRVLGLAGGIHQRWLLPAYALGTGLLYALGPWPTHAAWSQGYTTLYLPFLFIGSVLYLLERRQCHALAAAAFVLGTLALYRFGLAEWQARWLHSPFAFLALALFGLLWWQRRRIGAPRAVVWLSSLTYAVYLLHNWLYDVLLAVFAGWPWPPLWALLALFSLCAALVRVVERPSIAAGRRLAARWARQVRT